MRPLNKSSVSVNKEVYEPPLAAYDLILNPFYSWVKTILKSTPLLSLISCWTQSRRKRTLLSRFSSIIVDRDTSVLIKVLYESSGLLSV